VLIKNINQYSYRCLGECLFVCHRPPQPDDEFVLCVIQMDSRGVLSVQPDFNKGRKPYRLVAGVLGSGRGGYYGLN